MIWIIAGTLDGRKLAVEIQKRLQTNVFVSVVSSYGAKLANQEGIEVYTGKLNQEAMEEIIDTKDIHLIIDASHPYAELVTNTAIGACHKKGIPYIRYERKEIPLPKYDKLHHVNNEVEAAAVAGRISKSLHRKVYLTTGSKTLPVFAKAPELEGVEVWTRVLSSSQVLKECEDLGFSPKYIVALQGPFSYEMNKTMFRDTGADVVIMKNSGLVGGSDTKFQAAIDLGIHIVLIDRPKLPDNIVIIDSVEDFFELGGDKNGLY